MIRFKNIFRLIMAILMIGVSFTILRVGAEPVSHTGIILETMDASGYTYMNIDENGKKFWIAAPQTAVEKGEKVSFHEQIWMPNFTSETLNRTFDNILFVGGVIIESSLQDLSAEPVSPESASDKSSSLLQPPESMSKDAETYTIADIYSRKDELKGRLVKVHGNVTKVNSNIMGKTWVHIEDGTGSEGSDDIVVTSKNDTTTVGTVITAQGTLYTDKDLGSGYFYSVIIEDSSFFE